MNLMNLMNRVRKVQFDRKKKIRRSFTRLLAHKPMGDAAVGPIGSEWRRKFNAYAEYFAQARASGTVRR